MLTLTSGAGETEEPNDTPATPPGEASDGPYWCTVCGKASAGRPAEDSARRCPYCRNKLAFRFPPRD